MLKISLVATVGFASLVAAGPCPFHHLRDAAAAGNLGPREAAIVHKMARDPSYIPALDPDLPKRAAEPEPRAQSGTFQPEAEAVEKRGLLPTGLPIIGGGLRKLILPPLPYLCNICSLPVFSSSEWSITASHRCPSRT